MRTKKITLLIATLLVVTVSVFLVVNNFGRPGLAKLEVDSNPQLELFIDGKSAGKTPYDGTFSPKELVIQIGSYETKVALQPGIKTIIRRDFSNDLHSSSGMVVSFEKNTAGSAALAIVSDPGGAQINLDGIPKGFTPLNINDLSGGTHQLDLYSEGSNSVRFPVNLESGYKLIAVVDLSPSTATKQTTTQNTKIENKVNQVMVKILDTPTGFLRVRSLPTIASDEVAEVHPGEQYPFIKQDDKSGWFDILLTASASGTPLQSGWISNTYAATSSAIIKP